LQARQLRRHEQEHGERHGLRDPLRLMSDDRFEKAPVDPRPWRERSPFVAVVDDPNELIVEEGRITRGAEITWTREAVSQVHLGYRCGICGEAQETAWPKLCWLCKR